MNGIDILILKERVKCACVCKTWSIINMKYFQEAHNEARFFSDSLMKRLYETQDLSSIVNSMRKYYWHHVYGASCLRQIQTFICSPNVNGNYEETIENEEEEDDDFSDELSINEEDEQNSNGYDEEGVIDDEIADCECDRMEYEVEHGEFSIKDMIEINILRKEPENKSLNVMKLCVLENFDSTIITHAYEMKHVSYNQMDTNQKDDYFEAHSFYGMNGIMNTMEQTPDHINRMSVTDLVKDCVTVIHDYREGFGNATMCSFAVRLLKQMFQNVTSMREISSGIVMEELLLMMKLVTRTPDLISSLWLTMAICESNPTKKQEFFKSGGLDIFMRVCRDKPKICTMFAICGFIYQICNVNFEDEGSPTVSNSVIHFFTKTVSKFNKNEFFVHSVCKTILCLSSDHDNRIALKRNGCIQVMKEIHARHQRNPFILKNSHTIIFRLNHTKA